VAVIAERATDWTGRQPGLGLAPPALELPPGSVPVDAVRSAIRRYRAGIGTADQLIAAVDHHGDALEREIAGKAVEHMADFQRTINRLEVLAGYISTRVAQLEWLKTFPAGPGLGPCEAVPLHCPIGGGRRVEVGEMLAALRAVKLSSRAVQVDPQVRRLDGRRGATPSMAALADAGVSATDVALALGVDRGKAWAILNGHQRTPPELRQALERLVGVDQAAVVLDAIPQHPRARAPASLAVDALHSAGATALEVAPLIPVAPSTVRKWLRGKLRPSPEHAAALAGALEQLVGAGTAAVIVSLIPKRTSS
jgi:hypothetical protein